MPKTYKLGGRPQYQTEADKRNEEAIARHIETRIGKKLIQLSPKRGGFWMIAGNDPNQWVFEIRTRRVASTEYPDLKLSAEKWKRGIALGTKFCIVCQFTDRTMYYTYRTADEPQLIREVWGRKDRADAKDVAPSIGIPMSLMKPFEKENHRV